MASRCSMRWLVVLTMGMVLVGGLVAFGGCGESDESVIVEASWTQLYHDIGSLKQASDVAVAGSIAGIAGQTVEDKIPYTDFTFAIQQVIFDPHQLATGTSLVLHQTGGTTADGQQFSVSDDPLFRVGEQAILFLHQYSPGHFYVEGGPSGRFVVRNGVVSSIDSEGVKLNGPVSEADFITQIEQA